MESRQGRGGREGLTDHDCERVCDRREGLTHRGPSEVVDQPLLRRSLGHRDVRAPPDQTHERGEQRSTGSRRATSRAWEPCHHPPPADEGSSCPRRRWQSGRHAQGIMIERQRGPYATRGGPSGQHDGTVLFYVEGGSSSRSSLVLIDSFVGADKVWGMKEGLL